MTRSLQKLVNDGFDISALHGGAMIRESKWLEQWKSDPSQTGPYRKKFYERSPSDRGTIKTYNNLRYLGAIPRDNCVVAPWLPHCNRPVKVFRIAKSCNVTKAPSKSVIMWVPCRHCDKCLKVKASLWAARAKSELALWAGETWSLTLTFSPRHLSVVRENAKKYQGLAKDRMEKAGFYEVQKYFKVLRRATGVVLRYLAVAEYGGKTGRLHYHVFLHEVVGHVLKKTLEKKWASIVHARLVKHSAKQAEYLCKYVTKSPNSRIRASRFYGNKNGKAVAAILAQRVLASLLFSSLRRHPKKSLDFLFIKLSTTLCGTSLLPIHKTGDSSFDKPYLEKLTSDPLKAYSSSFSDYIYRPINGTSFSGPNRGGPKAGIDISQLCRQQAGSHAATNLKKGDAGPLADETGISQLPRRQYLESYWKAGANPPF